MMERGRPLACRGFGVARLEMGISRNQRMHLRDSNQLLTWHPCNWLERPLQLRLQKAAPGGQTEWVPRTWPQHRLPSICPDRPAWCRLLQRRQVHQSTMLLTARLRHVQRKVERQRLLPDRVAVSFGQKWQAFSDLTCCSFSTSALTSFMRAIFSSNSDALSRS